mgnify:CR=1 FL=1
MSEPTGSLATMARHVRAMLELKRRGSVVFDYGNNLRGQALTQGVADAFAIGGTASYASEINGGTVVATSTEIPDWWRGDLFAEYRFTAGLSARLNVLNITDETYFDTLYRSATPFVYVAPGRSAQLTFEYEF